MVNLYSFDVIASAGGLNCAGRAETCQEVEISDMSAQLVSTPKSSAKLLPISSYIFTDSQPTVEAKQ